MKPQLEQRRNKLASFGLTAQPIPIIVGEIDNITSSFVSINNILYKVETPLKAVDISFKVYNVLNACYPPEAEMTWSYIEQGIYKLVSQQKKSYVAVNSFIADIDKLASDDNVD